MRIGNILYICKQMKKKDKLTWEYDGSAFSVGECIIQETHNDWVDYGFYKLVFLNGKLYKFRTQKKRRDNRITLFDFYTGVAYWTKAERVFQIIKLK